MAVEDLFTRERGFDRATGEHGQFGRGGLVLEQLELATEPTTHWWRDHAYLVLAQAKRFGQLLVYVVRRLGAGPHGELAGQVPLGDARVLFEREVGVALEKVRALFDVVRTGERGIDVAELEGGSAVGITEPAFVDGFALFAQPF